MPSIIVPTQPTFEDEMNFRIRGLDPQPFAAFFAMTDAQLAARRASRQVVDAEGAYPCRVTLADAPPGTPVILLNYEHQAGDTPYRSSHAIFVSPAREAFDAVGAVPPALRARLLSIRAFDANDLMVDADVVEGRDAERLIARLLEREDVSYLHAHFARRGCFAARIDRAF
ncbi:MAG TPA: DUF1203 domain-containing protein [Usitatibacter sp.]|jgi:hypothetical protein|nr:DUF1203 domain-containing protein [Usitatibacter sp.]